MSERKGLRWSNLQLVAALDHYFSGLGFSAVGESLNRTARAVEDMLMDVVPHNGHGVINLIKTRNVRCGLPWSRHEKEYLRRLIFSGRTVEEASVVHGRSVAEIERELESTRPARGGRRLW